MVAAESAPRLASETFKHIEKFDDMDSADEGRQEAIS